MKAVLVLLPIVNVVAKEGSGARARLEPASKTTANEFLTNLMGGGKHNFCVFLNLTCKRLVMH